MTTFTTRLNLEKPTQGVSPWKTPVDKWADQLDKVAAQYLSVHLSGVAIATEVFFDGFFFDEDVTITKVTMYAREAPSGAAFSIDFTKGGSIQTKIATIADGLKKGTTTIAGLTYATTEELGLKVTGVGSVNAGSEITILIHYNVSPLA